VAFVKTPRIRVRPPVVDTVAVPLSRPEPKEITKESEAPWTVPVAVCDPIGDVTPPANRPSERSSVRMWNVCT
jgi:hypothetical protein